MSSLWRGQSPRAELPNKQIKEYKNGKDKTAENERFSDK
jgi:hypothetical protein